MCNTCSLQENLEKDRIMLNSLMIEKTKNLLNQEIINLSQSLDILVYKCIFCNENLNDIFKLKLRNIFGTHSSFYYYGYQHLFNSMYFYITEGINNNEFIYISMEEHLYNKLVVFLKSNSVSVEYIKFRPIKDLIDSNTQGRLTQLKEKINNVCSENEVKEYNGIRWIGQSTFAIQTTSQESFLDWETNLSEALNNTNASLLCIYDTYDYMNKSEFINETVIEQSLTTHSYILNNQV